MNDTSTRRAVFGAAAAAALPLALVAAPQQSSLTALWAERQSLFHTQATSDQESDIIFDRLVTVEAAILKAPINSRADAAVKARMAVYAMHAGERGDGADEASMLQLAEWLESGRTRW